VEVFKTFLKITSVKLYCIKMEIEKSSQNVSNIFLSARETVFDIQKVDCINLRTPFTCKLPLSQASHRIRVSLVGNIKLMRLMGI